MATTPKVKSIPNPEETPKPAGADLVSLEDAKEVCNQINSVCACHPPIPVDDLDQEQLIQEIHDNTEDLTDDDAGKLTAAARITLERLGIIKPKALAKEAPAGDEKPQKSSLIFFAL